MALHRGIQSAIFYYLSCAPCAEASYRRKRRQQAKLDREEQKAIWELHPNAYRHPSPFATNPAWKTEMDLGPTHGAAAERKRKRGETDLWHMRTESVSVREDQTTRTSAEKERAAASPHIRNDSRLGIRSYQREDEDLWGTAGGHARGPTEESSATVVVTRPPAAHTAHPSRYARGKSSRLQSWQWAPTPQVNDRHPPTVTNYRDKDDVAWMLQPPPPARVMQGKEPARRSRPDNSSMKVNRKIVSSKQSKESGREVKQDLEASEMVREKSNQTTYSSKPGHLQRAPNPVVVVDHYPSSSEEESPRSPRRRKQLRMPPVAHDDSDASPDTITRRPLSPRRINAALPPTLSTIPSPKKWEYDSIYDHRRLPLRSEWETVVDHDDDSRRESVPRDSQMLRDSDIIEAWYGWATEKAPRTVNHRWSMDI